MRTKLLHEYYVYQYLQMSLEDFSALLGTDIVLYSTTTEGDFMLLANTNEVAFLTKCGLNLEKVYCDYFIVKKE